LTPFYIDFSVYPEAVAEVLYKEMQKHAFELWYKWQGTGKTIEKYSKYFPVVIFEDNELSKWIGTAGPYKKQISVEEFLEMKKEPEYHVGMPMINEDSVSLYLKKEGELPGCFTGVALKHSVELLQYIPIGFYDAQYWKPIDPSRIKVTIN
jgi:hypothetical protein